MSAGAGAQDDVDMILSDSVPAKRFHLQPFSHTSFHPHPNLHPIPTPIYSDSAYSYITPLDLRMDIVQSQKEFR